MPRVLGSASQLHYLQGLRGVGSTRARKRSPVAQCNWAGAEEPIEKPPLMTASTFAPAA